VPYLLPALTHWSCVGIFESGCLLVASLAVISVLWYGGNLVLADELSAGELRNLLPHTLLSLTLLIFFVCIAIPILSLVKVGVFSPRWQSVPVFG
jgi:hypothetical protein